MSEDKRMGELFAQDRVPLPRPDPRDDEQYQKFMLNMFDFDRRSPFFYGEADSPALSRAAGIEDIDARRVYPRPGARTRQPEPNEDVSREQGFLAGQGISRRVNPERFSDALTRMPLSEAPVEYEPSYYADPLGRFPPATFAERFGSR